MLRRLFLGFAACLVAFSASAETRFPYDTIASPKAFRGQIGLLPDAGVAPRRNKYTWMTGGQILSLVVGSQTTYFYAYYVPDDAYAVRFIIPTLAASNGATLGPIRFRPSATPSGASGDAYVNPDDTGPAQGGSGWNYVTFCDGGINNDPVMGPRIRAWNDGDCASAASGVPGVTQLVYPNIISPDPTTGSTGNGRLLVSDWNYMSALARTDTAATAPRILMVRAVAAAGTYGRCAGSPMDITTVVGVKWNANSALNLGYDFSVKSKAGDIETGANITGTASVAGDTGPICGVQFLTRNKGVTIFAGPGDSHTMGNTTTGAMSSLSLRLAVALSNQNLPIGSANAGWSGAASDQFVPSGLDLIDIAEPSIALIQTWGHADSPTTQATAGKLVARALQTAQKVKRQGGVPVLLTPFPRNLSAGAELTWQGNVYNEIIAAADAGNYLVFDVDSVLSQQSGGAPTFQYVPAYTGDNIHPNDAGIAALVTAFSDPLRRLIGCNAGATCP